MSVLFVGIGGGMDIFGCVPLLSDVADTKKSYLINLSFMYAYRLEAACLHGIAERHHPWVYEVFPAKSKKESTKYLREEEYFPEFRLATHLGRSVFVLIPFDKKTISDKRDPTIGELSDYFRTFLVEKKIQSIFYVDGGCDSLMKGNELGLGTPTEDMFTLRVFENAVHAISNHKKS